jgi:diadenosine tetraphosphatase ApaH/serine/threonine PP2A family protein phosphatase
MRYAILGDIHANWEALMAVMEDSQSQRCTHYSCVGDIVGYNADPGKCAEYVRRLNCPVVKGNHDEEVTQERSPDALNPLAKSALLWTRKKLTEDQKQWLRELPLVLQVQDFTIVHATLDSPGSWAYVANGFDAMASFSYQSTQLCFHGHTHAPCIYEKDGTVRCLTDTDTTLRRGVKYFINVGSVGQPRDGDWRASYAVYDVEKQSISIRRLEYDLLTTQRKVRDAGLFSGHSD